MYQGFRIGMDSRIFNVRDLLGGGSQEVFQLRGSLFAVFRDCPSAQLGVDWLRLCVLAHAQSVLKVGY